MKRELLRRIKCAAANLQMLDPIVNAEKIRDTYAILEELLDLAAACGWNAEGQKANQEGITIAQKLARPVKDY